MADEIAKIKPKRVAVIVKEDGTREIIDTDVPKEYDELSLPKHKSVQTKDGAIVEHDLVKKTDK